MSDQWNYTNSYLGYDYPQENQQWYDWHNQYYPPPITDTNNYVCPPSTVNNYYPSFNYHFHCAPETSASDVYCNTYNSTQVSYDFKQELELYKNTKNQYIKNEYSSSVKESAETIRSRSRSKEKKRSSRYRYVIHSVGV